MLDHGEPTKIATVEAVGQGLDSWSQSCDTLKSCFTAPPPPPKFGGGGLPGDGGSLPTVRGSFPAVGRRPSGSIDVAGPGVGSHSIAAGGDLRQAFPCIVKFSGGRSSVALAFLLVESGLLRPECGDAILFANTSAKHPATYDFAGSARASWSATTASPFFFWFKFCTVENAPVDAGVGAGRRCGPAASGYGATSTCASPSTRATASSVS